MTAKPNEPVTTGFDTECKFWFLFNFDFVWKIYFYYEFIFLLDDIRNTHEGIGTCGWILVVISYIICALTFPFSLCVTVKVGMMSYEGK